ncbi:MAG: carboxylating nicotinate-nucleotide diphosphorylase [Thermoleophilia bacterium]
MSETDSLALVRLALREDLAGFGDVTSVWTVPEEATARARIVAREALTLSGLPLAAAVLREVDSEAIWEAVASEGEKLEAGEVAAVVRGRARSLLGAERTMLNLLSHLSGVATQARRFADAVRGTGALVVDTRKTTPGLRFYEKRAVRHGGCRNHRFGLFDQVLIKDNHLVACGGIEAAVTRARREAPAGMRIEVEVEDLAGLEEAIAAGADIVMLDNMTPSELAECVGIARSLNPRVLLEASGGVDLQTVREVAQTGVDLISTSALTAGAPPVDLGLDFDPPGTAPAGGREEGAEAAGKEGL